jgi:hypothetical protein
MEHSSKFNAVNVHALITIPDRSMRAASLGVAYNSEGLKLQLLSSFRSITVAALRKTCMTGLE